MKKKQGISLIVLVITIIVMIILAASIVITLNNTGVISKANESVDRTNEAQVQDMATMIWMDAYLDEYRDGELSEKVINNLKDKNITEDDWNISVNNSGVIINAKPKAGTLGYLIKDAKDYGKTVNYEANGITKWRVFYKQTINAKDYVYLIASEKLSLDKIPTNISKALTREVTATVNGYSRNFGNIYWLKSDPPTEAAPIQNPKLWLANYGDYTTNINGRCVSYLLSEEYWREFKNTAKYGSYVVGAIGTPTAEMFVESWNEKREATGDTNKYNKKLALLDSGTYGYYINDISLSSPAATNTHSQLISTADDLYLWSTESNTHIWLASPAQNYDYSIMGIFASANISNHIIRDAIGGLRPVICIDATMPATIGSTTDIAI